MGIFSEKKKKIFQSDKLEAPKCFDDEITLLTQSLIDDTRKEIENQFRRRMSKHKSTLTKEEAEAILLGLIDTAIANRKLLCSEIEKSISDGDIYAHYYNRITLVNELANEAYVDMRHMKNAKERYEHKLAIYNNITSGMYLDSVFSNKNVHKEQTQEDKGDEMAKARVENDEIDQQ